MEKKKNSQPYIIPPSYFKEKGIQPVNVSEELKQKTEENKTTEDSITTKNTTEANTITQPIQEKTASNTPSNSNTSSAIEQTKPALKSRTRRTSALSLNSIRRKKEHEESKVEKVIDPSNLPTSPFTEEDMQAAWKDYGKMQDKKGERIVGSMFAMNTPTLKGNDVCLELPNESMKVDMQSAQSGLLQFLYKRLDNYSIDVKINVNEEVSKKYAFTPQDKYDKLREKNPLIDKLRSTFDLDI